MNRELKWLEYLNRRWASRPLDGLLPWMTHLGSTAAVLIFVFAASLLDGWSRILCGLLLLYALQFMIAYSLKFLLRRRRPPAFLRKKTRLEIIDPSFPSVHTVCAFTMATLLSRWFPDGFVAFYLIAAFVGWTRVYLCLHYPTDVIAGGLLGYGVTTLFLRSFHLG
jgi:undecaprenyl-diphosphatase